jgi:hypothetical protein
MFIKKLIKPIIEVCKKNCSCVCDEMIYRIAKEQGITIVSISMKQTEDKTNEKNDGKQIKQKC